MFPAACRLPSDTDTPQSSWERLNRVLANVGDLAYRRRILSIVEYLAPRPEHLILDLGSGEGFVQLALQGAFGCRVAALDADAAILRQGLARGTEASGPVSLLGMAYGCRFPTGSLTPWFARKCWSTCRMTPGSWVRSPEC